MTEYLTVARVIALHDAAMERTGSTYAPLRDEGLLESAIMRARTAAHYEGADLVRQAALLAIGISQNQPFVDGNKRTADVVLLAFLRLNDHAYVGKSMELARQLEQVAERTGSLEQATYDFEAWLCNNVIEKPRPEPV
jgi:death-on-curing protein